MREVQVRARSILVGGASTIGLPQFRTFLPSFARTVRTAWTGMLENHPRRRFITLSKSLVEPPRRFA